MHDGHDIVGAETALDELPRRAPHALRSPEARMEVVDDHHVHTAVERLLVRFDVRFDRRAGKQRAVGPFDRNIDQGEGGDDLRFPVLEDLKVFLLQIADELALPIGHDDIDLDVVDADLESGGLRRRRRRRSLAGGQDGTGQQHDRRHQTPSKAAFRRNDACFCR